MISCIIIDDEKPARDALELMLNHYFGDKINVLGKAESLKEGVFAIYKHKPDIVFLDIEMPEENGFNIFGYFQQITFAVIFTTAYKEYAIKAIKVAALDYILKPIGVEDLKEAIGLYEKRQMLGISADNIDKLVNVLTPASLNPEKIAFPTFNGFQLEKVNSIMYCEADQNYTKVYLISGKVIIVSKTISVLEKMLPNNSFCRIHRSYNVNLNYVKNFNRINGFHIVLEDGTKLNVSSSHKDEFLRRLTSG
jgi:two-component system LytT family response regulator